MNKLIIHPTDQPITAPGRTHSGGLSALSRFPTSIPIVADPTEIAIVRIVAFEEITISTAIAENANARAATFQPVPGCAKGGARNSVHRTATVVTAMNSLPSV